MVSCLCSQCMAGINAQGKKIFLKDIWPMREEIQAVERQHVIPGMFKEVYQKIEVMLCLNACIDYLLYAFQSEHL